METRQIEIPAFFKPDGVGAHVAVGRFDLVDHDFNPTLTSFGGNGNAGAIEVAVSGERTQVYLPTTEQYGLPVLWRFSLDEQSRYFDFPGYAVLCDEDGVPLAFDDGTIISVDYSTDLNLLDLLEGLDMSVLATIAHRLPMSVSALQAKLAEIDASAQQADIVDLGDTTDVSIVMNARAPLARKLHLQGNGALTVGRIAGDNQAAFAMLVITSADPAFELTVPADFEWVDDPMPLKPQAGYKILLSIQQLYGSIYASAVALEIPGA